MENEKILKIVNFLYREANGWGLQTKIIKHDDIAELLKIKKLVKFKKFGTTSRETNRTFTRLSDLYTTVEVSYFKKKLLKYLVKHGIVAWGNLEIKPNGVVLFKGIKSNKLFLRNNKARKMLLYLILLEYATVDELFNLLNLKDTPLLREHINESEKTKNEFLYKYRKYRIKILRCQAIDNLIKVFSKKGEEDNKNIVKDYAEHMFYYENDGYGIVDFDVAELASTKG